MIIDRKLSYSRENGTREPRTKVVVNNNNNLDLGENTSVTHSYFAQYEKKDGVLSSKIVCIISGGEHTEKEFFKELMISNKYNYVNSRSVIVEFVSKKGQGLHPFQMQEKWSYFKKSGVIELDNNRSVKIREIDSVYLVSDVDEFYDQILKERDKTIGASWIISNPCFEMWLYYCFRDQPEKDLCQLLELPVSKRSRELKHLCNDLHPGGMRGRLAFEKMRQGIENSAKHYQEDDNSVPKPLSTQMHILATYLINIMDNNAKEYDLIIKSKRSFRKQFC